jgi:acetyl/propionyl-CoA carboxylase alpha subunit/acetyl-CoA carboxylase carboxyltransferase component
MGFDSLLVANRGEIAVRVMRSAAELGLRCVAVHPEDDAASLHVRRADAAVVLPGRGAAAYLDAGALVEAARDAGAGAIHPGYGFLSEDPDLARRCDEAGLVFVGPSPECLALFGDKLAARRLAGRCGVPVLRASEAVADAGQARAFLATLGEGRAVLVKAVAGGGGRGLRVLEHPDALEETLERCRSEARHAFGRGDVYLEELLPDARHLEVQVVGDGRAVCQLGERECTLQRRHQKLVEWAPSPRLEPALRESLLSAAVRMASQAGYRGVGTFEFLVAGDGGFVFLEANARLQVEHTVTEEVTGVDLVRTQLELARGRELAELGLSPADAPAPRGFAVQVRVNAETMTEDGTPKPAAGTLATFEIPSGPGLRTDTAAHAGYTPHPGFDSLLAKLVAHSASPDPEVAFARARRGLAELRVEGVPCNRDFLLALLGHPDVRAGRIDTRFVDRHAAALVAAAREAATPSDAASGLAGARIDADDPLAVLAHGKRPIAGSAPAPAPEAPEGTLAIEAPIQGTVLSLAAAEGDLLRAGQPVLVMEAMKMEHVVSAPTGGALLHIAVAPGDTVFEGHTLAWLEARDVTGDAGDRAESVPLDHVRPDLAEVHERHALGLDAARPEAVARRHRAGQRTARENVEDLCDPGSFTEYGPLVIAAQRRRRDLDDLVRNTPADGMLAGVASINGHLFPDEASRCVVMSYDYTVLAGTQGAQNHRKKDRMFELALEWKLPLVFFTEGGGGRPGDTDGVGVAGLDCMAFHYFGRLSGLVPLVGIVSGRCFAGNAALLGCCDVVIATEGSNIGMGGPAMIEGGGLGVFRPEEVGPLDVQVRNGVVDLPVRDEAEAVAVARRYLSYFQGPVAEWQCADQRLLRHAIPENRRRIYDVRHVIETLVDGDSLLELRRAFGRGMVTALARVEGRPLGIVANDPAHLAGAIDSDGADKAARFMQLCDAFDLPILFLCDTPGIMVGPEAEKTALVRHASRLFVTGGSLTVPFFTIVLRKGYGLGAQAMAGGSFKAPFFTVCWPTAEFGGMGLEGAVKLGYRKELEAREDPAERRALYEQMLERMYEHGKAVNTASMFELDDVIDPVDSRAWIVRALRSVPPPPHREGRKRPCVDTW